MVDPSFIMEPTQHFFGLLPAAAAAVVAARSINSIGKHSEQSQLCQDSKIYDDEYVRCVVEDVPNFFPVFFSDLNSNPFVLLLHHILFLYDRD